jgi:hypothetical protein
MDELLSMKDLAALLKRSEAYVWAMRKQGFKVIAGRTTLSAALVWLSKNPCPCSRRFRKVNGG